MNSTAEQSKHTLTTGSKISIALCTYNGEKFLQQQLGSIADQTRPPWELVVCDDGSSDRTVEIIKNFAARVPFNVRIFRNDINLKPTKNFEKALNLCTGDFIALCDQDDVWHPRKLERQSEILLSQPEVGGVFSDGEIVDEHLRPTGERLWTSIAFTSRQQRKFRNGDPGSILLIRNVVTGATLMVRANLRPVFAPIPESWTHDGWIAWLLAIYSNLAFIDEPLIRYRAHTNQQVGVPGTSLRQRVERSRRIGATQYRDVARQFEDLRVRLSVPGDSMSQRYDTAIQGKIVHSHERSALYSSAARRSRIPVLLQLLRTYRDYRNFAQGWKSIAKDFLALSSHASL